MGNLSSNDQPTPEKRHERMDRLFDGMRNVYSGCKDLMSRIESAVRKDGVGALFAIMNGMTR